MADKTQVNPEKLKVLSAVMDKIEKDFGQRRYYENEQQGGGDRSGYPVRFDYTRPGARYRRLSERPRDRNLRSRIIG